MSTAPITPQGEVPVSYERKGDWILTYSGLAFWPLDPRVSEVRLADIAHALSNTCRYGGHTRQFYSVAQHSVLVAQHLAPRFRAQGLMHDATEAYLLDIPRPVKRHIPGYAQMEDTMARCIGEAFNLELEHLPSEVKHADTVCLFTEKRDLRPIEPRIDHAAPAGLAPWPERILPWTPAVAESAFLLMAREFGVQDPNY